jgi:hypothetical protein
LKPVLWLFWAREKRTQKLITMGVETGILLTYQPIYRFL